MPSPGDHVVFEGVKIGGGRREGELVSVAGRGVTVRWPDGSQSFLIPGPGAMRVVAAGGVRGGSARRDTSATGTIKDSVKRGSSKRTATSGGDFREAKPSGVSKTAGAARGAGKAGGSRKGASEPGAGRGKSGRKTAGAAKRQVAVERAVAKTVTKSGTKKRTLSTPSGKKAKKR